MCWPWASVCGFQSYLAVISLTLSSLKNFLLPHGLVWIAIILPETFLHLQFTLAGVLGGWCVKYEVHCQKHVLLSLPFQTLPSVSELPQAGFLVNLGHTVKKKKKNQKNVWQDQAKESLLLLCDLVHSQGLVSKLPGGSHSSSGILSQSEGPLRVCMSLSYRCLNTLRASIQYAG